MLCVIDYWLPAVFEWGLFGLIQEMKNSGRQQIIPTALVISYKLRISSYVKRFALEDVGLKHRIEILYYPYANISRKQMKGKGKKDMTKLLIH